MISAHHGVVPRAKADPELVAATLELLAAGCSLRDAGEWAGVTATTVQRWARETKTSAPPAPAETVPDHMASSPPAEAISIGDDMVAGTRAMVNDMLRRAVEYEAAGNMTAAQRQRRDAATIMPVLARLTQTAAGEADMIRIARHEVTAIERSLRERIAATLSRPLLCAHCSRALSVAWGTEGLAEPDAADPGAAAKSR